MIDRVTRQRADSVGCARANPQHIVPGADFGAGGAEIGASRIRHAIHREAVHRRSGLGHQNAPGPIASRPGEPAHADFGGRTNGHPRRLNGRLRRQRRAAGHRRAGLQIVRRGGAIELIHRKIILGTRGQSRHIHACATALVHHKTARRRGAAGAKRGIGRIRRVVHRRGRRAALPGHHQNGIAVPARPVHRVGSVRQIAERDIGRRRRRLANHLHAAVRRAEIAHARAGAVRRPHPVIVGLSRRRPRVIIARGIRRRRADAGRRA